jgi:hypothetical protein
MDVRHRIARAKGFSRVIKIEGAAVSCAQDMAAPEPNAFTCFSPLHAYMIETVTRSSICCFKCDLHAQHSSTISNNTEHKHRQPT